MNNHTKDSTKIPPYTSSNYSSLKFAILIRVLLRTPPRKFAFMIGFAKFECTFNVLSRALYTLH
jgi:hypothetical protein